MNETICVLDVNINNCSAKQAMKLSVGFMDTAVINVVELVTIEALMCAKDEPELKRAISQSDLVLPGQKEILEAAGDADAGKLREVETQLYLKMYLKYLHRNHSRVYLLVETDEEVDELTAYFASRYKGIQIVGAAKVASGTETDDMLVNAINGNEADCVIAILHPPVQELFIARNRSLINARIWLGAGGILKAIYKKKQAGKGILAFVDRLFFKHEIEKNRREMRTQG